MGVEAIEALADFLCHLPLLQAHLRGNVDIDLLPIGRSS